MLMNKALCIFRAMRPHQWLKNLLVFFPLITSAHYKNFDEFVILTYGFIVFSLMASAVYIFNDISDIENDRLHVSKKHRPFASGQISVKAGLLVAFSLLAVAALASCLMLPMMATSAAFAYLLCTFVYTFWIKRLIIADAVLLGLLYTLRIIFGALVLGTGVSFWILSFSLFCFTGLAFMKRVVELSRIGEQKSERAAGGRAYVKQDKQTLEIIGVALSLVSVLIFCLYLNDIAAAEMYKSKLLLWALVPALIYWNARVWLLVDRGLVHDDPIVFAVKDKATWAVLSYAMAFVILAGN